MAYQRGSGFVGLQQYLNANQQQGQAMGGSVAGRVEGQQHDVRSAADSTINDVTQAAATGTPTYSDPGNLDTAQARAAGVGTTYTGPQGLSPEQWSNLNNKATAAGTNAQYGTTDAGVATLLQQQYGKGYTGVGGRTLDSALARRGAGERLDYAAGKGMDALRSYLGTTNERAIGIGQQGFQNAANVRQQYAQYQPTVAIDEGPRRNPIQTPGTMPGKPPRKYNAIDRIVRTLTGGDY